MASVKDKRFHVFESEELSIGEGPLPYIFKFKISVYANQLKPLADPTTTLAFHVVMWCYDHDHERRKQIKGVRYNPLTKRLTKVTDKVEAPYVVNNQKEVLEALAREAHGILTGKTKDWEDNSIKECLDEVIKGFCKKCGKDYCECKGRTYQF